MDRQGCIHHGIEAFQMPFQGILGAEGFLNRFVVTFHAYENYFLIEHPDEWGERNQ